MGSPSLLRVVLGVLLWGAALAGAGLAIVPGDGAAHEPAARLARFVAERPAALRVAFPPEARLRIGDPVFVRDAERFLLRIGRVEDVRVEGGALVADLSIHPEQADLLRNGVVVESFTVPVGPTWVVETLLPPDRLEKIRAEAASFLSREGEGLRAILWPEVREGIREVVSLYEREIPSALAAHSGEWERIYTRHREGVIKERLLPALEEVTLPLATDRFSPLLEQVGAELWRELPVWSLGWRYVWDKMDVDDEKKLRLRFRQYLEEKAVPILAAHTPEAGRLAVDVMQDSLKDPRVKQALAEVFGEISSDPEFLELLRNLAKQLVVENEDLHRVLAERWESGLKDAVEKAARRMEPMIQRITDAVVLDESRRAINPRLAQVLRSAVFRKDGRWVMVRGGDGRRLEDTAEVRGGIHRD